MKVTFRSAINRGGSLSSSFNELKEEFLKIADKHKDGCSLNARDLKGKYHWSASRKCFLLTLNPPADEVWTLAVRECKANKIMSLVGEKFRVSNPSPDEKMNFEYNGYKVAINTYYHNNVIGFEVSMRS